MINPETVNKQVMQASTCDKRPLHVSVENKDLTFSTSDKSLLECIESAKIEIHSHCRDGFCGVCRITLVEGEVTYPQGDPLAYVGDNEILPCCCVPTSDIKIIIE